MSKPQRDVLVGIVDNYIDSLDIPSVTIDVVGGNTHSMNVIITVPDGYKDDVDDYELLRLVSQESALDDVEVSFSCYTESEFKDALEGDGEDPDAGLGEDDPDEEDELKADSLVIKDERGRELEGDYADANTGEDDDEFGDDEDNEEYPFDDDDLDVLAVDEYTPTIEDIREFGGFKDEE